MSKHIFLSCHKLYYIMVLVPNPICQQYAHSWWICYILFLACSVSLYLRITSTQIWHWGTDLRNLVHLSPSPCNLDLLTRCVEFWVLLQLPSSSFLSPHYTNFFFLSNGCIMGRVGCYNLMLVHTLENLSLMYVLLI